MRKFFHWRNFQGGFFGMSLTGCVQFIGEARALIGSFKAVVEPMGCDQSSGLGAQLNSSSGIYPAGKLQWLFTCGFDFGCGLWLPFVAGFAVLVRGGGVGGSCESYGFFLAWDSPFGAVGGGALMACVQSWELGAPCLPKFILLGSFSDSLLEDLILVIHHDCHF